MRFQDKVAIVTGEASAIGLAVAKRLASEGARLVIADANEDELQKALPLVKAAGAPQVWLSVGSIINVSSIHALETQSCLGLLIRLCSGTIRT